MTDHELTEKLRKTASELSELALAARHPRVGCVCNSIRPCAHHAEMLGEIREAEQLLRRAANKAVV